MKQFYELYKDNEKMSPLVTQLSWTNHLKIMSACKSMEERIFYMNMCIKEFILEIGKDFTFIGEEYRVQVGKHDYYIDLLFYHRGLSCLVAFELKIGEFKPEYIGKINLYLEALDREVKKENENPSVGIILCASKDDEVVEFAQYIELAGTVSDEE